MTSVDPPELVRFIKTHYPDVAVEIPHDKNGNPVTMWNLIPKAKIPPTQMFRYCCKELKESSGKYRVTLTGVRKAESVRRAKNQGTVTIIGRNKRIKKIVEESGASFAETIRGGVILNFDNDTSKNVVDMCYRTTKTLVNPIIDWSEDDVWNYLNSNGIEHCCLYDEGWERIGCIGCPMGRKEHRLEEFQRWPKFKEAYIRAFERMLELRSVRDTTKDWATPEDVFEWWVGLN